MFGKYPTRKVFTESDPVCANTSGFIGVIAAATITMAAKVMISLIVVCRFVIMYIPKMFYDLAEYYCC
jgi:hypothetical protein